MKSTSQKKLLNFAVVFIAYFDLKLVILCSSVRIRPKLIYIHKTLYNDRLPSFNSCTKV